MSFKSLKITTLVLVTITVLAVFLILYFKSDPDYRKNFVSFISFQKNPYRLYIKNLDGSPAIQISPSDLLVSWYKWSPDGRAVAIISGAVPNIELYIIRMLSDTKAGPAIKMTNKKIRMATRYFVFNGYPKWSPDGQSLAFILDNKKLMLISPIHSKTEKIPEPRVVSEGDFTRLMWRLGIDKKTGLKKYVPYAEHSNEPDELIKAFAAIYPEKVGKYNECDYYISRSPDGKNMALWEKRKRSPIWIILNNSKPMRELDLHIQAKQPVWLSDSKRIIFCGDRQVNKRHALNKDRTSSIWIINSDGTGLKLFKTDVGNVYFPAWKPCRRK